MHALNFLRYWLLPLSFVLSGTAFNVKRDCGPNPTTLYSGQIKGVNPVGEGRSPVTFGWVNQGPSQGGTVGSGTGVGGNFQLELEGAQYSPSHSQPRGTFNFQSCGAGDTFYLICKVSSHTFLCPSHLLIARCRDVAAAEWICMQRQCPQHSIRTAIPLSGK